MLLVVCLKQVPDTQEVKIDPRTNALVREGVPAVPNPDDLHALAAAVAVKKAVGGRVAVLSMGPPQAVRALRKALSLGADRVVLLSDRIFAAADTFSTTYTLARGIARLAREEGEPGLVLCGKRALDGETGQVGPGLAARLGYPYLGYVIRIKEIGPHSVVVERYREGITEELESPLPALLTVEREIAPLPYASLPRLLQAQGMEVEVWSAREIEASPEAVGLAGSPTKVVRGFVPPPPRGAEILGDGRADPEGAARLLADVIMELEGVREEVASQPTA